MPLKTKPIRIDLITNPHRFWSKAFPTAWSGCLVWTSTIRKSPEGNYGLFSIHAQDHAAHRVAFELTHGQHSATGMMVCHSCDVPLCVNPNHLFLGTHRDNMADMLKKGRAQSACSLGARPRNWKGGRKKGSKGRAKGHTSARERKTIVRKYVKKGLTHAEIAKQHELSKGAVGRICRRAARASASKGPERP